MKFDRELEAPIARLQEELADLAVRGMKPFDAEIDLVKATGIAPLEGNAQKLHQAATEFMTNLKALEESCEKLVKNQQMMKKAVGEE